MPIRVALLFHIPHEHDSASWSLSLLRWSAFPSGLPLNHLPFSAPCTALHATAHLAFLEDFLTLLSIFHICAVPCWLPHSMPWSFLWSCCCLQLPIPVMAHSIPKWVTSTSIRGSDTARWVGMVQKKQMGSSTRAGFPYSIIFLGLTYSHTEEAPLLLSDVASLQISDWWP